MLIVGCKDVKYCSVSHKKKNPTEALPGVSYRGFLFAKVTSYGQNHLDKAIRRCREFLDLEVPVLCLIIKESTGFSLWYADKSLELTNANAIPAKQIKSNSNLKQSAKAGGARKSVIPFFNRTKQS